MESNKSKGVEFRNDLQNRVESLLYDTLNQDFRNRKDVCKALQDIVDEALAHPQQSEGVELIWDGTYDEDNYLTVTKPSEPAALKEPQGSAPAVVITDGEIESIAIELISKHGRWADDEMEYQASEYEFTAALKEFASLLTNHKS